MIKPAKPFLVNFIFSMNRQCNLRCKHCNLSNEFKKNTEVISDYMIDYYCELTERCLEQNHEMYKSVELILTGGEITLMPKANFFHIMKKMVSFYERMKEKYSKMESFVIATNLVDLSEEKKQYLLDLHNNPKIGLEIMTSYDLTTERFRKPILKEKWEKNMNWFIQRGLKPIILWSICSGDLDKYKEISDYLFAFGCPIHYLAVGPVGEAKKNDNMVPAYENLENFFINFFSYIKEKKYYDLLDLKQENDGLFERVCNIVYEQNGYIFLGVSGQDEITRIEKLKLKPSEYETDFFIHADKDINITTQKMINSYKKFVVNEQKYFLKTGCYECEFFEQCYGGDNLLRSYLNEDNINQCSGFKKFQKFYKDNASQAGQLK